MSTLAEIEKAAAALLPTEAEELERRLHALNETRRGNRRDVHRKGRHALVVGSSSHAGRGGR